MQIRCLHTHTHARIHKQIHTHTHVHNLYTKIFERTRVVPSPHSTYRGRADTYSKLAKPLKTPSGTLVSWFEDRERYLWAWQT